MDFEDRIFQSKLASPDVLVTIGELSILKIGDLPSADHDDH